MTGRERRAEIDRGLRPLSIGEASAGMLVQGVLVRAADVVFLKGIVEASEGLASVFAERGGELTLAAPAERAEEFAELLQDLARDVGARLLPQSTGR